MEKTDGTMAADATVEDYPKKQRIINALAVYPDRYDFDAGIIADLADSSESYVYRLYRDIEAEEITESKFEDELVDNLQDEFSDRIESLLEEADVGRGINGEETAEDTSEQPQAGSAQVTPEQEAEGQQTGGQDGSGGQQLAQEQRPATSAGSISVEQVRTVRSKLDEHRQDAAFGRENYEGPAVDVAHAKYSMSTRAIELLDELINDAESN